MQIAVRLYATLRKYAPSGAVPAGSFVMELPEGSCVRDLLAALGLTTEEAKLVFVRSRRQDEDYVLTRGDEAAIFPPIGGG